MNIYAEKPELLRRILKTSNPQILLSKYEIMKHLKSARVVVSDNQPVSYRLK